MGLILKSIKYTDYLPSIIISGKMLTGKNTVMDIFMEYLTEDGHESGTISCARQLKEDVCKYLDIPLNSAYTQEGKAAEYTSLAGRTTTLRKFLQSHGENMKKTFGLKYWINYAIEDAKTLLESDIIPICDDARFIFELNGFVHDLPNSVCILITRPDDQRGIDPSDPIHQHESETEIPDWDNPIWDYVIDNSESMEELRKKVWMIYADIKIRFDI